MRQERTVQASIFDLFASHEIGQEQWLDDNRDLLGLVARDLCRTGTKATGRQGLPAEAVLRCALLKQYRQLSYQELAFHLEDSASFRAFARLPWSWSPKKSVLQRTISAIRPQTWEEINRMLLSNARQEKLENGAVVRLDSTVTYYAFPDCHWIKIRTNNPLGRIMKEIRRWTRVVGAFPDGKSCLNPAAARLRHIAGTKWSSRKYMNMVPSPRSKP